jgi:hypothetical protein
MSASGAAMQAIDILRDDSGDELRLLECSHRAMPIVRQGRRKREPTPV